MSEQQTALQRHLNTFIKNIMKQKFRLDSSKTHYEELLYTIRERVIDETDLINRAEDIDAREQFEKRAERDESHINLIEEIIQQKSEIISDIAKDVYYHLIELSNIEINSSGFITHIITSDEMTDYNNETKVIRFKEKGKVEVPIATVLRRWTDSSQMRIIPISQD